jgi:hypothetical protein
MCLYVNIYSEERTAGRGQSEEDSQKRTGRTGHLEPERQRRTGRTGQLEQGNRNWLGRTRQPGWDYYERTVRNCTGGREGQAEQDSQNRGIRTG